MVPSLESKDSKSNLFGCAFRDSIASGERHSGNEPRRGTYGDRARGPNAAVSVRLLNLTVYISICSSKTIPFTFIYHLTSWLKQGTGGGEQEAFHGERNPSEPRVDVSSRRPRSGKPRSVLEGLSCADGK